MSVRFFTHTIIVCLLWAFALQPTLTHAALPTAERLPASAEAPLSVLSTTPDGVYTVTFGEFKNKALFTWSGSTLTIIDLEIWSLADTQPDTFPDSIADVALLGDGITLVVALTSGDLAILDLSDTSTFSNTASNSGDDDDDEDDTVDEDDDSRLIDSSSSMDTPGITAIAVDPDSDVNTVYMIDQDEEMYYEIDLDSENVTALALGSGSSSEDEDDATTTDFTPTDIAFAAADSRDTILISTTTGVLLVGNPGDFSFTEEELDVRSEDESAPTLASITLTPDENFAYLIDTDNDLIWVYGVSSGSFEDQISGDSSLDPLEFDTNDENATLTSIAFLADSESGTVHGYVSGDLGVSIIDASDPGSPDDSKFIDTDDSSSTVFDPITLSATPSLLTSLSDETLTLLSANGDATISVISDNPYVSVEGGSVSTLTEADSVFTLTFQTDEAGTYTVFANSDPLQETGLGLIGETVIADIDTDTTTIEMDINDFDRDAFVEGSNKFYVFVTDADGNLGWDAAVITVDRPPEAIDITSATFGDQKIFVNFDASSDGDIDHYTIFAEPAADQTNPTCPGALTFTSSATISDIVSTSNCDSSSCSAQIDGLANGIAYCIAVNATDESDQDGPINGFDLSVTPEQTVGPAEFLGETGCSLIPQTRANPFVFFVISLPIGLLLLRRSTQNAKPSSGFPPSPSHFVNLLRGIVKLWQISQPASLFNRERLFVLFFLLTCTTLGVQPAAAKERTPQNWTFEVRGTYWFPTRSEVKDFFGGCCNLLADTEFGWLATQQFNITAGAGFGYRSNNALGINSGASSGDTFKMWIIPMHLDAIYRFDYKEDQLLQPFVRVGMDSVLFREYGAGDAIMANKLGLHGGVGLGILLDKLEALSQDLEADNGVNDVYLVFEGRYAMINSFSQVGMDFSGIYTSVGILFEF